MTNQPNQGGGGGTVAPQPTSIDDAARLFGSRRQAAQGAQAASPPAAPATPAPSGGAPSPQPPQQGGQAQEPASLTGAETAEQLASQGIESPNAHERIRELGRAKNDAEQRAALLEAEGRAMKAEIEAIKARLGPSEPEAEPPQPYAFNDPFPEDGTIEEQETWRMKKIASEVGAQVFQAEMGRFVPELGKYLEPVVGHVARQQREEAWGKVNPALSDLGIKRDEIEGTVNEMIKANPNMPLEAAVWSAVSYNQIPVAERVRAQATPQGSTPPETISTPSQGRPAQGQVAPREQGALEELQQIAENAKGGGMDGLSTFFGGLRRAGGIQTAHQQTAEY